MNNQWTFGHSGGTTNGTSTILDSEPDSDRVAVTVSSYGIGIATPTETETRILITQH
ncbi:hypothetical protein ABN034_11695 [Actinopolymorpha sp. B11F2]|uniref:hypothetical protein n=1 Tax=Actinopolymorpha sp. B11F2 TaxID=3160862 RepID=UPI0032E462D6